MRINISSHKHVTKISRIFGFTDLKPNPLDKAAGQPPRRQDTYKMSTNAVPQFADEDWYTKAVDYWSSVDPTVNGMLGGFESVCPVECAASLELLDEFVNGVRGAGNVVKTKPRIEKGYACDCGAGIGRVTKEFLLRVPFAKVDLVEQTPKFVEQAKEEYLKEEIREGKVGEVYCKGLQEFTPETDKYDLIWCQWVLGHLTDGKI